MSKYRIEIMYYDGRLKGTISCDDVSREGDYLLLTCNCNEGKYYEILSLRQEYRFRIREAE